MAKSKSLAARLMFGIIVVPSILACSDIPGVGEAGEVMEGVCGGGWVQVENIDIIVDICDLTNGGGPGTSVDDALMLEYAGTKAEEAENGEAGAQITSFSISCDLRDSNGEDVLAQPDIWIDPGGGYVYVYYYGVPSTTVGRCEEPMVTFGNSSVPHFANDVGEWTYAAYDQEDRNIRESGDDVTISL